MPPDEIEPPVQQQPAKKRSIWKIVLVIALVLFLIGGVVYAWASIKHPEWFAPKPVGNASAVPSDENGNPYALLIFIGVGGAVILLGYLIWKGLSGRSKNPLEPTKIPVMPDRAILLFREHFAVNNGIQCKYDREKEAMLPANPHAIIINDKLPYYHTATGDNFLLLEVEVREGNQQGIHSIIIPIDKGEDIIKGGYYRQETHTPRFQFNLQKINYPMSSLQDKQDRLRFAMADKMEDADAMKKMLSGSGTQQPNYITTPLDAQEGEQPFPPRRPDYRRRQYRRRPYYRR